MNKYEILLKKGNVIDPANNKYGSFDIGIKAGKIACVSEHIDSSEAETSFDLSGLYVMPGIVDMHMHSSQFLGGPCAHKMLALAGVTTALDMAGPIEDSLKIAKENGTGLTIAILDSLQKGYNVNTPNPSKSELEDALNYGLCHGSLGMKLMGGNYPLDPESTSNAIQIANERRAYIAFHAATTKTGSNIEGFHEAIDLAGNNYMHLAHINSYCRGMIRPCEEETLEAIEALKKHPKIRSEAYLANINGNTAKCSSGKPIPVVCNCLRSKGYSEDIVGLEKAIGDGWAQINVIEGGTVQLRNGEIAIKYWKAHNTDVGISFAVNPPLPRYWLATAKRENGDFVVDAISTDGGGIPRNYILKYGLSLVKFGALSLKEYVYKASINPGRIIGFKNKGQLGEGADADITVFDFNSQNPYMSIGNGKMIMYRGLVCGTGCNIATSKDGADFIKKMGLNPVVVNVGEGKLYNK